MVSTSVYVCLRPVDLDESAPLSPLMVSHMSLILLADSGLVCVEKKWGGQRGIASCIAMSPACADTYAVGSYSGQGESVQASLASD